MPATAASENERLGIMLALLMTALAPPGHLRPASLRANRVPASASEPGVVDSQALTVTWDLACAAGACRGLRQEAYRLLLRDADDRVVLDTGRRVTDQPQHSGVASALRSARRYGLEVTVWSGSDAVATTSVVLHTAVLEPHGWQGEWIGGYTQLRGDFLLAQPRANVVSALAHATGVGCFALTANGHAADANASNASYMNPGWANVPTVRMLYRQFDVTGSLLDGENVLGVRLGQCKYGYQGSFCSGAHGSLSACRAFNLMLTITFQDGTQQVIASHASTASSRTSRWLGTTTLNPIRYRPRSLPRPTLRTTGPIAVPHTHLGTRICTTAKSWTLGWAHLIGIRLRALRPSAPTRGSLRERTRGLRGSHRSFRCFTHHPSQQPTRYRPPTFLFSIFEQRVRTCSTSATTWRDSRVWPPRIPFRPARS